MRILVATILIVFTLVSPTYSYTENTPDESGYALEDVREELFEKDSIQETYDSAEKTNFPEINDEQEFSEAHEELEFDDMRPEQRQELLERSRENRLNSELFKPKSYDDEAQYSDDYLSEKSPEAYEDLEKMPQTPYQDSDLAKGILVNKPLSILKEQEREQTFKAETKRLENERYQNDQDPVTGSAPLFE